MMGDPRVIDPSLVSRGGRGFRWIPNDYPFELVWVPPPDDVHRLITQYYVAVMEDGHHWGRGRKEAAELAKWLNDNCIGHWEIHPAWMTEGDAPTPVVRQSQLARWFCILFENAADREKYRTERGADGNKDIPLTNTTVISDA